MRVLHITNSYGGTAVYMNLYAALDCCFECEQWVYVPLNSKNHNRIGNMMIDFKNKGSKIHYATLLKRYHSYLYGAKISSVVKDIEHVFNIAEVDVIHASTLCFDGAVAYELSKKYGKPYIVAVRNTDVHTYYNKLFWRKPYFTRILLNAERVIFISPKYKDNFLKYQVPFSQRNAIGNKMDVIPNGVNRIFLSNRNERQHIIGERFNLIFVAAFYKGKGLIETIQAVESLRNKGIEVSLNAIGMGLPNRPQDADYINKVQSLAAGKPWITLQPFKQVEQIIEEMRLSDAFIMVSKPETFGLVYVEALSQGLPIIYASDEGFDGFYKDGFVGYPASPGNVDSIASAIELTKNNYRNIITNIKLLNLDKDFDWNRIAHKYFSLYNTILNK